MWVLCIIHLCKERYHQGIYNKLNPKKIDPYKILKRINENTYLIDLTEDLNIRVIFNFTNLYSPQVIERDKVDGKLIIEWSNTH